MRVHLLRRSHISALSTLEVSLTPTRAPAGTLALGERRNPMSAIRHNNGNTLEGQRALVTGALEIVPAPGGIDRPICPTGRGTSCGAEESAAKAPGESIARKRLDVLQRIGVIGTR